MNGIDIVRVLHDRDAPNPAAAVEPVNGQPMRTDAALSSVRGGGAYDFESDDTRRRFESEPRRFAYPSQLQCRSLRRGR